VQLINFQLRGRFAHFLRAEASASALSYPIPPRTAILGILGAILGIPKDEPQVILEPAKIAISGKLPATHWHRAKLRKDPPAPLPRVIKKTYKPDRDTKSEKATLILQEWLFEPVYTVWVSIPEPYHSNLELRLRERRWHFTPYLGLSEMMADIEYLGSDEAFPLPKGSYDVISAFPQDLGEIDMKQAFQRELAIHRLRMPQSVSSDRVFHHVNYLTEREARAIPVITDQAYRVGDRVVMLL
jgi:CRISPR-associated protein Cas5h